MCFSCIFSKTSTYLFLLLFLLFSNLYQTIFNPVPKSNPPSPQLVKVVKVIDGDTIEIAAGKKVRYIGIDAAESHDTRGPVECFAQQAFEKNRQLVEGKTIKLEKDVSETDRYGRLLRYVFIQPEATSESLFVNRYLVEEGYATVSTFPPDVKYAKVLQEGQRSAKENKKGLWKACP